MQILNPNISYKDYFDRLAESSYSLLMLDYDGTLSPFTADRDNAKPYEHVVPLIKQVVDSNRTRVVIISGRSVAILRKLIGDDINCELWGSHGAERYADQKLTIALDEPDKIQQGLEAVDNWAEQNKMKPFLEIKTVGRAFHWRGEPDKTARNIAETVEQYWSTKVDSCGLSIHLFDGGIEIRPAAISKANAVSTLLSETNDDIPLAYLGDDLTDEDAFAAIGNRGLKVLVREELRETAADIRISPPRELLTFLKDWCNAIST